MDTTNQAQQDVANQEGMSETSSAPPYVAGIGASAGGLEALERLFKTLPTDTGMAFVIVQHLSPDFDSVMDELLVRQTTMPVHTVEDGMSVEPNAVYLIPPKKEMIISGGKLLLTDKDPKQGLTLPIDTFLRSLAQDYGARSIGVIRSGTGSDGSRGIRNIHTAGGMVLVQSEDSAKFDGMPKSAQETGVVDLVLAPEQIAETLAQYARSPVISQLVDADSAPPIDEDSMNRLMRVLRETYGTDFTLYKQTTVTRRIERRLLLTQAVEFDDYVAQIESNPHELNSLYHDLLIGVTQFFRDREAFSLIEKQVLPELLHKLPQDEDLRIWVAGCATGEEAYSLAILVREQLAAAGRTSGAKIFATDVHRSSLDVASTGIYPESALADVSTERRRRFFTRKGRQFQVHQDLRQMVVFAKHNVMKDAPFTRLDLITCRNLLIYLQPVVQKKVISLFHFGLKTSGVLFLGPSEGVGDLSDEFKVIDQQWRVFRKLRDIRLSADLRMPLAHMPLPRLPYARSMTEAQGSGSELDMAYRDILEQFAPPSVLINQQREVLHVFGNAADFLQIKPGPRSNDILDLFDADLRTAVSGAIQRATKGKTKIAYTGVTFKRQSEQRQLKLSVLPLAMRQYEPAYMLISLEELETPAPILDRGETLDVGEISRDRIAQLESELHHTKENLQTTIEELETSNEELHATNEEMVASNEELQSTNEELHSVNEELYTVNAEYQRKITELTELTDDMENLLASTDVGVLFLDKDLCIRKFTPRIAQSFNIVEQDVGRAFEHFTHNIRHEDVLKHVRWVLTTGQPFEKEVRDRTNSWYFLRVLPYQSKSHVEGVVLTLIDIDSIKVAEAELHEKQEQLQGVLDNSPAFVYIKDLEVQVNLLVNAAKYTPNGGKINLRLASQDGKAFVSVSDTGVGMTKEFQERVFEPFVQSKRTLDRRDGGIGLGLTLVRSLVEMHDGEVGVHSDGHGKGSEFTVWLPLTTKRRESKSDNFAAKARQNLPPLKLLVVEDNADVRNMMQKLLEVDGFQVCTATDGLAALTAIEVEKPDLALVDIGLPELDGYEVARRVRKKQLDVYLIALTGYGQRKDRSRSTEAGFDDHLTKPVNFDHLRSLLVKVAERRTVES